MWLKTLGKSVFHLDSEDVLKDDDPLEIVHDDLLFIKAIHEDKFSFHFLDLQKTEAAYTVLTPCGIDSPVLD